jgi:hypothetical protein
MASSACGSGLSGARDEFHLAAIVQKASAVAVPSLGSLVLYGGVVGAAPGTSQLFDSALNCIGGEQTQLPTGARGIIPGAVSSAL